MQHSADWLEECLTGEKREARDAAGAGYVMPEQCCLFPHERAYSRGVTSLENFFAAAAPTGPLPPDHMDRPPLLIHSDHAGEPSTASLN